MFETLRNFYRDDQGSVAIEYGLAAALIAVALIPAFEGLANSVGGMKSAIGSNLASPVAIATVKGH